MRIALVVERFDPLRGGLEQWSWRLAERLAARGHEVHAVSREFTPRALSLRIVPHYVRCGRSRVAFAEAAQAVLQSLDVDVIHDMGAGWFCDVLQPHGGSWASVSNRKLLLWPAGLRWLKRWISSLLPRYRECFRLMARQYADRGQTILALSRSVADDFQQFHQISPERVRIIYNGVDADHYSPASCAAYRESMRRRLGVEPGRLLALVVAQNLRLKGVPTLLRAMARLTRERLPLDLVVVGGKQLPSWRRRTERLGAADVVRFIGPVEDPLPYYAAADLYVHPTLYDTCSLVVLEAAACGLPLITSRYNGAAELLEEGRDCLLLSDPTDPGELAARMAELLDAPLRRRMGAAARQTALRHTFEHNVDQVLEVYQEVLDRRARVAGEYSVWTARVSAGDRAEPLVRAENVAVDGRSRTSCVPHSLDRVLPEQEHSHENRAGR